jgi:protein-S-isoprenylcysteine O-methyltransferase Ste14
MLSVGVLLVIVGVGSLVLPQFGVSMGTLANYEPWGGIILAAVGLITVIFAARWRTASTTVVEPD